MRRWWQELFGELAKDAAPEGPAPVPPEPAPAAAEALIDNDSPIRTPAEDLFGVDRFAAMVARSLAAQGSADGTVIALHGPWGSGKSSVVNLALHHLRAAAGDDVEIIAFNPWWFAGSSALASAFFQTIGAALNRTLRDEGRDALGDFFVRLKSFDTYAGAVTTFAKDGIGQAVAQIAFGERSIEDEHRKLAEALRAQAKSFLIVIDDIDRLSPDEALLIFGLVKSVGRLPRVSYLLAFDRLLIERLIELRFPSEGKLYLEKIVQAMFDLPLPPDDVLRNMVLEQVNKLIDINEKSIVRFMNLFYDIVAPSLTSPRQSVRLSGALRVSWPSVAGEVDPADFVAIEALRLFHPALYRNIRQNPDLCCKGEAQGQHPEQRRAAADAALFRDVDPAHQDFARIALKRLFPKLEGVWGNMHYGDDWAGIWAQCRFITSTKHFPIYFQYGLEEGAVSKVMLDALITRAADADHVQATLRAALAVRRRTGGSQAALILDELNLHSAEVARDDVEPLLAALFEIADELDIDIDRARGFSFGNNQLRIHWLINRLLMDRFDLAERSALLLRAAERANLVWLASLARRCFTPHDPDAEPRDREGLVLVDAETARLMMALAVERVRGLAANGGLGAIAAPSALLWFLWHVDDAGKAEARAAADAMLDDDAATICLAESVTSIGWSQGGGFDDMGDRVAKASPRVDPESLARLLDADRLHARVTALAGGEGLEPHARIVLERFLTGWDSERRVLEDD